MKKKINLINNCSIMFFFASSFALVGIPFLDFENVLPPAAYVVASIFWAGLVAGTVLQIVAFNMWKKIKWKTKPQKTTLFLVPPAVFGILELLLMIFLPKNVMLVSIDTALLLFSIEIFFYFKRRNSI